jgi:hypothetical protein
MTEEELRLAVMKADLALKQKQSFWETPKAIAIIVGVTAAVVGTLGGLVGFKLASAPTQQIVVHLDQPLAVKVQP